MSENLKKLAAFIESELKITFARPPKVEVSEDSIRIENIEIMEEEQEATTTSLRGPYKHKCLGWAISESRVIPGVHTMPNGDPGYPDDVDVVDLAFFPHQRNSDRPVVRFVLQTYFNQLLERFDDWVEEPTDEETPW